MSLRISGPRIVALSQRLTVILLVLLAYTGFTACSAKTNDPVPPHPTVPSAEPDRKLPINFLIIVADDLGFSDLGFAGSEIHTPTIDTLAQSGVVLTQFYTAPTCSPTRSMLLTGVDHHRVGLGSMHEIMSDELRQNPGYEGYLTDRFPSLPEQLRAMGYRTFMAGKWHLGLTEQQSPAARGFDRSFAMLNGGASHFADKAGLFSMAPTAAYREDGKTVASLPNDFFSSTFYADKVMAYIDEARNENQPFFGYLAFTAPHWPLQAPDNYLNRYRGAYAEGWNELQRRRFNALKELNWIPDTATLPEQLDFVSDWSELTPESQQRHARDMEIYAAMVEHMDAEISRVMNHLDRRGLLDNTLIIFFSDNGPEGTDALTVLGNEDWVPSRFDNRLNNLGRQNSYTSYGPGWAQVSATPLNLFKSFPTEGGIKTPAVIKLPGEARPDSLSERFESAVSVADIAPTLLAIASGEWPAARNDTAITMSGHPIAFVGRAMGLKNNPHHDQTRSESNASSDAVEIQEDSRILAWELFGRQAVRVGRWKALKLSPPIGTGQWQLFDLSTDPGERVDLALTERAQLANLIARWNQYAEDNGVVKLDTDVGYGKR